MKAVHILNKPLPLSVWMKQLPPYTVGCKTQITLVFKNMFKAASLSCFITDSKNSPYLIKTFLK